VQKFGGTSVGSIERIRGIANKVAAARERGDDIVVVVSAMSGETNRLVGLAHEIVPRPDPREYDQMVASGEQVTISLLAIALKSLGVPARSFLGHQVPVRTDGAHTKARIQSIGTEALRAVLDAGGVPVVAGFQGIADDG